LKEKTLALEVARDSARQAALAKSAFLASVSHELRTPLNAILGYSELLLEEAQERGLSGMARDLGHIRRAGQHLLNLINQILDYARIEAGRVPLSLETFPVSALILDLAATVQPLIGQQGNTFRLHLDPEAGQMYSDPTRLRQILYNLLSNACKFTRQGHIELSVERRREEGQDWLFFAVSDTGVGIAPQHLDRIFDEFYQVKTAVRTGTAGTGLGLAITWHLCRALGGSLQASSRLGQGSTFTVHLPAQARDVPGAAPVERPGARLIPTGRPGTVLVVDDDPEVRDVLARLLARDGLATVTACDGLEALRRAQESPPDAIILDLVMPRMDGWAVLTALKNDPRTAEVPVILISTADIQCASPLGAVDILPKPVDSDRLRALLRRHLGSPPRLLVVEDEEEQRRLLSRTLRQEGWLVQTAGSAEEALAVLGRGRPDLIILDLLLPGMDGFQFLHALRSGPGGADIPVLVLTARDLSARDRRRLEGSVQKLLQKGSCSRQRFLEEVRDMVRRALPAAGDLPQEHGLERV
jgi:CheY-like chemotaxis protein/nitrogen-specific signal transduction histidine kinase